MKISFLCSDALHPVNAYLEKWLAENADQHALELVRKKTDLRGGDILFLVACAEIITEEDRSKYSASLVLHASDLPRGRGWSPHIWEILQGAEEITLSLLEAEDQVDSGRIWKKVRILIPKHALWAEINDLLFKAEIDLIDYAVHNFDRVEPLSQSDDVTPNYYPRRTPKDSLIDPRKSLQEQFDLIRVCDPNRFPAYFDHLGHRYLLKLEKSDEQ